MAVGVILLLVMIHHANDEDTLGLKIRGLVGGIVWPGRLYTICYFLYLYFYTANTLLPPSEQIVRCLYRSRDWKTQQSAWLVCGSK